MACTHCGETHVRAEDLTLHVGRRHAGVMTRDARDAFARAEEEERVRLERIRRHAKATLQSSPVLAFGFFVNVFILMGAGNVGFLFMGVPAIAAMFGMIYFVSYHLSEA